MGLGGEGLRRGLLGHDAADVDQVVGNHPEADPALDSGIPLVPAAIESMPSFDHADAAALSTPIDRDALSLEEAGIGVIISITT